MLDAGVDGLAPGRKPGRVMLHPETVVADLGLTMLLGLAGAVGAWLLRRRTTLSARNLYPPAAAGALALAGAIGLRAWNVGARPVAAGVAVDGRREPWERDGDRATWGQARSFATTSSDGVGSGNPRLSTVTASGCTCARRGSWSANGHGRGRSPTCR